MNNRNKIILILLIILASITFVGHEVYSYYTSSSTVSYESASAPMITLDKSFNPTIYNNDNDEMVFLSGEYTGVFDCSEIDDNYIITCQSNLIFSSDGTESVEVEITNINASGYEVVGINSGPDSSYRFSLDSHNSDLTNIELEINLKKDDDTLFSDEKTIVDDSVALEDNIEISFDIIATQVHD